MTKETLDSLENSEDRKIPNIYFYEMLNLARLAIDAKTLIIGLKSLTAHHGIIDECRDWLKRYEDAPWKD